MLKWSGGRVDYENRHSNPALSKDKDLPLFCCGQPQKGHLSSSPVCKGSQEEIMKSSRFWGIRTGLNRIHYFCQVSSIKTHYEMNAYRCVNMQSTHSPHRAETATHWHLRPHPCQLPWKSRLSARHWASVESWVAESGTLSSSFPRLAGMASRSQQC